MRPIAGSFPFRDDNGTVWLAFTDWGRRRRERVVVCVHGLTRQGRDFDALARMICDEFQVVVWDVVGRGRSGWLADKTAYNFGTYLRHFDALMDYRGLSVMDWIGTSMGGVMGMMLAARDDSPIRRLVLNDVGPFIPAAALETIGEYVGKGPRFANLQAANEYFQKVHSGFGALSDADWSEITTHSVTREADGTYILHYDPAIGDAFKRPLSDMDFWAIYDKISCPVLLLRGAESALLSRETAEEMTGRGPRAELVEIPGCGHAPSLTSRDEIMIVRDWLMRDLPEEEVEVGAAGERMLSSDGGPDGPHASD